MAISSPPSFSSVRTEFNNAGMGIASNLFAYRRGGGIVPDVSYYNAIGTGAEGSPVRLSQFAGLEGSAIAPLTNHSIQTSHTAAGGASGEAQAFSRCTVNSNGQLTMDGATAWSSGYISYGTIFIDDTDYWTGDSPPPTGSNSGASPIVVQNWLIGGGASSYSCRAVIQAGSTSPDGSWTFRYGTFGSWLALTSSREFSIVASATNSDVYNSIDLIFTLQFARTADLGNILGSCTITMSSEALWSNFGEPGNQ